MDYGSRRLVEVLIEAGRRLDGLGFVPARDGNLSARTGPDRVLVTATGVRKRELTAASFVEVDLAGRVRGRGRASTELGMHLAVYRRRPEVGAVVHAHPPVAVGFAAAGIGLTECLVPEVVVNLGAVPLTPYATPGTPDLEAAIADAVAGHDAFLLANHGAVTLGADVDQALDRMETLEHFARVALVSRLLGGGRSLSREAVAGLEEARRRAGGSLPITCTPGPGAAPGEDLAGLVARVVRDVLGSGS
jgi:L-fuculose-phosphate aldolase